MLANKDAMATIAVKDLAVAEKFYQQIPRLFAHRHRGTWRGHAAKWQLDDSHLRSPAVAGPTRQRLRPGGVGDDMELDRANSEGSRCYVEHYETPGSRAMAMFMSPGNSRPPGSRTPTCNILHINNQ